MSPGRISPLLRKKIEEQAGHRCGYCLTASAVIGSPLEIDHLFPESLGGPSDEDNLWLACTHCNLYKSAHVQSVDPLTGVATELFNPRYQEWAEHFAWSEDGTRVQGITSTGRATVSLLRLNRKWLVLARKKWTRAGWHPPKNL